MSLTLAQLGWIHEVGTKRSGRGRRTIIPPRPFLIPGISENRQKLLALERNLLLQVLHGKMTKRDAMGVLGAQGQRCVQEKIRSIWTPELADVTVARKTTSAGAGNKPLIDSGQMVDNVGWAYEE
jgi:hypothetical protein